MTYVDFAKRILDECHRLYPQDDSKAITFFREVIVAVEKANERRPGSDYWPSPNPVERGIDLIDRNGIGPMIQVKVTQNVRWTPCSSKSSNISEKALVSLEIDPNAEWFWVRMAGGQITRCIITPAASLVGASNRNGNPFTSIGEKDLMSLPKAESYS